MDQIFYTISRSFTLFLWFTFPHATLMRLPGAAHVSVSDAAFARPRPPGWAGHPGPAPAPLLHGNSLNLGEELEMLSFIFYF